MSHAVRDAAWDPANSIPTLIGSLLSLVATATVILLWIFAGGKRRRDFRYALILNLTVAGKICFVRTEITTGLTSGQNFSIV